MQDMEFETVRLLNLILKTSDEDTAIVKMPDMCSVNDDAQDIWEKTGGIKMKIIGVIGAMDEEEAALKKKCR